VLLLLVAGAAWSHGKDANVQRSVAARPLVNADGLSADPVVLSLVRTQVAAVERALSHDKLGPQGH
jgi:hypothetical protein